MLFEPWCPDCGCPATPGPACLPCAPPAKDLYITVAGHGSATLPYVFFVPLNRWIWGRVCFGRDMYFMQCHPDTGKLTININHHPGDDCAGTPYGATIGAIDTWATNAHTCSPFSVHVVGDTLDGPRDITITE